VLLAIVCLKQVGGIGGLFAAIDHGPVSPRRFAPVKSPAVVSTMSGINPSWFTLPFFVAWFANNIIKLQRAERWGVPAVHVCQRRPGGPPRRHSGAGLMFVGMFIWFIPPMTARLLIADQVATMPLAKPVEGAYAAISIFLLPPALVGIVLTGMCAATMSTLDSGLTSLAANVTENIYPALCRLFGLAQWQRAARGLVFARLVNLSCALVIISSALAMARSSGGVFKILIDIMATIGPPSQCRWC